MSGKISGIGEKIIIHKYYVECLSYRFAGMKWFYILRCWPQFSFLILNNLNYNLFIFFMFKEFQLKNVSHKYELGSIGITQQWLLVKTQVLLFFNPLFGMKSNLPTLQRDEIVKRRPKSNFPNFSELIFNLYRSQEEIHEGVIIFETHFTQVFFFMRCSGFPQVTDLMKFSILFILE